MRRVLLAAGFLLAARPAVAAESGFVGLRADAWTASTFLGIDVDAEAGNPARIDEAQRHAFLSDVVSVLEHSRSPIAANTLRALRSGAIHLDTLDRLTIEDCRTLISENSAVWEGVARVEECGAAQTSGVSSVPLAVLKRVSGFQNGNRIYVHPARSASDAAKTLVHEVNHVANHTERHYATAAQRFAEEYRAYWVTVVFEDGKAPSASYLAWLKRWIADEYALGAVESIPDRPAGNLDNDLSLPLLSLR